MSTDDVLSLWNFDRLPYSTAELPGTGGRIKSACEDFEVEEVPAYEPCGEGEHAFVWVEKRGLTTRELVELLARVTGCDDREIGVAGLKDKHAVTRQYVSLPARYADKLDRVESDNVRVLHVKRHRNKLRAAHLRGNRFCVVVRDPTADALERAQAVARVVCEQGFPNYFGPQRFGREGQTLRLGLDLLLGRKRPEQLPRARRRFLLRLATSAAQAFLFNLALARRLQQGLLRTVLPGDVLKVRATGGLFVARQVELEQARLQRREVMVAGPLFGPRMKRPEAAAAELEEGVLAECGLSWSDFERVRKTARGGRRPYLVWPEQFQVERVEVGLRFRFFLPAGCYATALLREFMKVPLE